MYGFNATPSLMVDGVTDVVGGAASGSMFSTYQSIITNRGNVSSPLAMASTYVMIDDEIIFDTTIDVESAVPGSNNRIHYFICQDDLHGHPNMVVDVLPSENFTLNTAGQSTSFQKTFTLETGWTQPRLAVVMVVQDMNSGEIIQATKSRPDYAATVNVSSDPPGVEAPWHLSGPAGDVDGSGSVQLNFFQAGTFTVTFEDIPYWTSPPVNPMTLTAAEDETLDFTGLYSDGPFAPSTQGPIGNINNGQGVNLVDYDGDGDLDVHVVNSDGPSQLMRNDNGTMVDVTSGLIAGDGSGRGATWADINGDGYLDVYLTNFETANRILLGDGAGNFSAGTSFGGADDAGPGTAASWADYDRDGILDLYITNFGEANVLLKSLSDGAGGVFVYSSQSGSIQDIGNGNAATWTDCDLDGRLDLYVVNQFNPSRLFQNTAIGFSDLTTTSGVGNQGKGMGAAWGDYDNDGDFDLYVANEGTADVLYRATSPFQFSQVGGPNLGDKGGGRGVVWVDLNNDMFLDLYVTRYQQPDLMLIGDGAGHFQRVPVGPAEADGNSNGLACGDLDADGRPDIFITRQGESNVLLSNDIEGDNHWFGVKLVGMGANKSAIGTRVVVTAGGVSQSRLVTTGSGYLCGAATMLHFGMADNTRIEEIEIFWPDGSHQVLGPRGVDFTLTVTQDASLLSAVDEPGTPRKTTLGKAYPNPFNPMTTIDFALATGGRAQLDIFTLDGRRVKTLVNGNLGKGPHSATWDGTDDAGRRAASGAYFYRLVAPGGFLDTGRVVMVK